MRANTIETLMSRVMPITEVGCWIWLGALRCGYGHISWENKPALVHRVMWVLTNGPIPDGMNVCHKCDTPPCCNPTHLFLGTDQDNVHDAVRKGRHARMQNTHCPQGHEYTEANTRYRTGSSGRRSKFCATCYRETQRIYKRAYRAKERVQ